eukprot:TRINITY_DN4320_c0_g1_i1.p1 TRINITY_DN4320_c0_g1~~TRINITY_DN4320_c0_g1_i1.p1  ORF type:complete len:333 (-),score=41.86 TRINITY_DN4320_c0_g1_i1:43-1041(-)
MEEERTTKVSIKVEGRNCPFHSYWDDSTSSCYRADPATFGETEVTFVTPSTKFFEITAPSLLGSLSISMHEPNPDVLLLSRWEGTPSILHHDMEINKREMYSSPRPGLWVIAFRVSRPGTHKFEVAVEDCRNQPGMGPGCATEYREAENNGTLQISLDEFRYWRFVASKDLSLNVSVTTLTHTEIPLLYVTKGTLPGPGNSDFFSCNQGHCDLVRSIHVDKKIHNEEVWFVGVRGTHANTVYGLWFNSTCSPDCQIDDRGTCEITGVCLCELDRTGTDCSIAFPLAGEYIFLIVFSAVILAMSLLGSVFWACIHLRYEYEMVPEGQKGTTLS